MSYLSWIEDDALTKCVIDLITTAQSVKQKASTTLNKNVMDPFSAIFQMAGFEMDYSTWMQSEEARQAQKSLQNHVGNFHQNIIGSIDGWQDLGVGKITDVVNSEKQILAEIKNKHNTVKKSDLSKLYHALHAEVMNKSSKYKDYTAYYVTILPSKPVRFNEPFVPSDNLVGAKVALNEKIRIIDGASFYHLVTGEHNAIFDLFQAIPKVVEDSMKTTLLADDLKNLTVLFKTAFS